MFRHRASDGYGVFSTRFFGGINECRADGFFDLRDAEFFREFFPSGQTIFATIRIIQ